MNPVGGKGSVRILWSQEPLSCTSEESVGSGKWLLLTYSFSLKCPWLSLHGNNLISDCCAPGPSVCYCYFPKVGSYSTSFQIAFLYSSRLPQPAVPVAIGGHSRSKRFHSFIKRNRENTNSASFATPKWEQFLQNIPKECAGYLHQEKSL